MKLALLLSIFSFFLSACGDVASELPVTTRSGLAFLDSRKLIIPVDTTLADSYEEQKSDSSGDCPGDPISVSGESYP